MKLSLFPVSDVFLTDGSRVSAATVASTAIAAAQWAVTQVQHIFYFSLCIYYWKGICFFFLSLLHVLNLFHSQTAQNGSGGGQNIDTAVYQQGAAVAYSQEGHEYSGLDGTSFKVHADARVSALPSAGTALMGAYTTGVTPGLYGMFDLY